MRVSVIVPSRLGRDSTGRLWAERAIASAQQQTAWRRHEHEVLVGVDRGIGGTSEAALRGVSVVEGGSSQAEAVNAAVEACSGEAVALLEDDDRWASRKTELQLSYLWPDGDYDLVTANQREVDTRGGSTGVNDFPTPSTWLLRRETWERLGGFDPRFHFHLDNELLGRARELGLRRVHLVEEGGQARVREEEGWLRHVARWSDIVETPEQIPLVDRLANPSGVMGSIVADVRTSGDSRLEYLELEHRFGEIPW